LNVPVPAHREGEGELWIAELGLVGELVKRGNGTVGFNRGVSIYPTLGDRVRVASRVELEQAFYDDKRHSVRVGCIRQDPSIAAMIRVDDLLGKHFAILGTTGTGKSWHHPLDLALHSAAQSGRPRALARSPQRIRQLVRGVGRGHQSSQHAAALLALDLRGTDRGADRQSAGAQGGDRDPAGVDPARQVPLRKRSRGGGARAAALLDRRQVHRGHTRPLSPCRTCCR
jgi:hypothetical protein